MDKINDIIDFSALFELLAFLFIGYFAIWLIGKIHKSGKNKRAKKWKRKNIKW